ncbi:hypothetical protein Hanom_Chr15g01406101 [Helianthus anomalus]
MDQFADVIYLDWEVMFFQISSWCPIHIGLQMLLKYGEMLGT